MTSKESEPKVQEYSAEQMHRLAEELDRVCPITIDQFGNELHACPNIDLMMEDYKLLRDKLRN